MDGKSYFSSVRSGAEHVSSHVPVGSRLCGGLGCALWLSVFMSLCSALRQDDKWWYQPWREQARDGERKTSWRHLSRRKSQVVYTFTENNACISSQWCQQQQKKITRLVKKSVAHIYSTFVAFKMCPWNCIKVFQATYQVLWFFLFANPVLSCLKT